MSIGCVVYKNVCGVRESSGSMLAGGLCEGS